MSLLSIIIGIFISRKLKQLCFGVTLLLFSVTVFAQTQTTINKELLCKVWKLEKYLAPNVSPKGHVGFIKLKAKF